MREPPEVEVFLPIDRQKKKCDKFKCVYDVDGECEAEGGECIGDMCECFGECTDCQEQDNEECDGFK